MGGQHSTLGRAKSLDETATSAGIKRIDYNYGPSTSFQSTSACSEPPILRDKQFNRSQRDLQSRSTLVIVNTGAEATAAPRLEDDPLFKKLQELPEFVPLMHEVENSSKLFGNSKRALAEIQGKIDPSSFINIVRLYEEKLKKHADSVSEEQIRLSKCVKEVHHSTTSMFKTLTERQKTFAKHAEKFGKMNDMAHSLSKCQMVLHQCKDSVEELNNMLPPEERLEPFVWSDETEK